ncbi:Ig-like domain-containing protein, partial [uncultured Vibrio sp.]|uniref:tandem-95 repeat protein n=2 Tax=uncultured Vibrio sp. TaxID=114054 RepID=UPI00263129DC
SINVLDNDTFGENASVTGVTQGANGTVTFNADGTVTYTPNEDYHGSDSFTYTVTTAAGNVETATVNVNVTAVNDVPVAVGDVESLSEDATLTVDAESGVLTNDQDIDGDTLSVIAIRTGSEGEIDGTTNGSVGTGLNGIYGELTLNEDGSYGYVANNADSLNPGEVVTDKFTYTVSDGMGGTDIATLTITVTGTNDAPIARNDVGALGEDATLDVTTLNGLLKNDSDIDGGSLEVIGIRTGAENAANSTTGTVGVGLVGSFGTLTVNDDGSYNYVADNADSLKVGEQVSETFTYTISDGQGGTDTATLTISVTGTNDGPNAIDDTYNSRSETVLFSESFEHMTNTGRWTVVTGDELGDWDATNGLEIQRDGLIAEATDGDYLAELDAHQNTAITTSIDTSGQDSVRVEFDYNPRRDGNSSSDMTFKVGDTLVTVHADGTLSGADGLNVQIGQPDANGWYRITAEFEVQGDTTELTFAGAGASDSYGALLDNITVVGINQSELATSEDQPIIISFAELLANDTDIDGDELSIVADSITSAANGTLSVDYSNETITFTPDKDYNGEATFNYRVTDGNGGEDEAVVTLNVIPVNDAPELTGDLSGEVDEAGSYTITAADLGYTDVDDTDSGVTFTVSNASNGTILVGGVASNSFTVAQLAAGDVRFKHDGSETKSASFDLNVEDGNEDGSTPVNSTFNLTVNPVNEAPIVDLNGSLDGIDFNSDYVEGSDAAIADINADIFDDKDAIEEMKVSLTNAKVGDDLTWVEANSFKVTKTVNGALIALVITHSSGKVSADEFEVFLKSIRFVNNSDTPDETVREVEVTVSDGVNQSEPATTSITVTVTENEPPVANDFMISSDTNVVQVNFSTHAIDEEDDDSSSDNEVTSVRIEELPEHGNLYELDANGQPGEPLEVGSVVLDSANIIYVADDTDESKLVSNFTGDDFADDNGLDGSGLGELELDGLVISGGKFDVNVLIDNEKFTDGDATIKYDHNPNQLGVFVHTSHDNGSGQETEIGEYISVASDNGNISSAEIYLSSVQGLFNNGHAKIVGYLFDNGELVSGEIELSLKNYNKSAHTASVEVSSDSVTFDEVRLAAINITNAGRGAGFNVSGVDLDTSGVINIEDEFKYSAIDSDMQDSLTQGTVTVNATSVNGGLSSGIDHVKATDNTLVWDQSSAHTWESESNVPLGYDELNGVSIDVGVGSDSVSLGAGSDTIYMGDSIVPGMDQNIDIANQNAVINQFINADIDGSTNDVADDMTYGDEDDHHKMDGYSNTGVDIVQSGGGNDTVYGEEGVDLIFGGSGHDILDGGEGNDVLRGGSGNDTLIGGLGDDILTGDSGDDIFKWVDEPLNHHQDVITDFEVGSDRIDLSELLHDDETMNDVLSHLSAKISDDKQDVELTVTNDQGSQTIILQGQASNLTGLDADGSGVYSGDELTNLVNSLMTNLPNA